MIEYKSGEELGFMKKSPHSPECVSSIFIYKNGFVNSHLHVPPKKAPIIDAYSKVTSIFVSVEIVVPSSTF